ncbi:hypothetical protein P167DRAFT_574882 [Morchella conica CCBAS932]|uniref:Uncharacterized protein n=1 Tax=Morchella conica CCBAS932 TaxID=1392247 RepID=A0A3N4KRP4_9PEZI|nr:hypothetical protein P167DRAFT_574882 [Morchella conica CCBAS932]
MNAEIPLDTGDRWQGTRSDSWFGYRIIFTAQSDPFFVPQPPPYNQPHVSITLKRKHSPNNAQFTNEQFHHIQHTPNKTAHAQKKHPAEAIPAQEATMAAKETTVSTSSTPHELPTPKSTPQVSVRSKTPELSEAGYQRLAAFLEKVFGEAEAEAGAGGEGESDNSSALIGLIGRESAVRAKRHQAWVEEVPEDEDVARR